MKQRIVLYAETGMILTNGSIYGKQIFLAEDMRADEFIEITEEQYAEIIQQQQLDPSE